MIDQVQRFLNASGHPAGSGDGIVGARTRGAWSNYVQTVDFSSRWPEGRQDASLDAFYGRKGSGLCRMPLPYVMRLAWQPMTEVKTVTCHELIAGSLARVLQSLLDNVGGDLEELSLRARPLRRLLQLAPYARIKALESPQLGIAIDLDPVRNGLRTTWPDAATMPRFAVDAFIDLGWTSGCPLGP